MSQGMLLNQVGKFTFYKYDPLNKEKQMQQEKQEVPIEIIKEQLRYKQLHKESSRVYLLKAGTGGGKSSLFVDVLLQMCEGKRLLCTKPRQALVKDAMIDLPKHYPRLIPGITMGYKIGGGDEVKAQMLQSVTFMTTQILTNMILKDTSEKSQNDLLKCKYIAIDEVHDISDEMIQVLYFIKFYLSVFGKHPECPLFVMMSATMQLEKFESYYDMKTQWFDVGLLASAEMRFPVEYKFCSTSKTSIMERITEALNYMEKVYIQKDIVHQEYKDVIILTKGQKIIDACLEYLSKRKFAFEIVPFQYKSEDSKVKGPNHVIFESKQPGKIKICVSTNLFEAGANLIGLYTVIDTGMRLTSIYNNIQEQNAFVTLPISQSSLDQRKGRVGRNGPGLFISLFEQTRKFDPTDANPLLIKRDIIQTIFLYLSYELANVKSIQDFVNQDIRIDIQKIDLIEKLSSDVVIKSYHILLKYGLIKRNGELTVFFFILLKNKYTNFLRYMAMFYGLDPFETCIVQYIYTRGFKFDMKATLTNIQAFEAIRKKNFRDFEQREILSFYNFVYEELTSWEFYQDTGYNPEGYKQLFAVFG